MRLLKTIKLDVRPKFLLLLLVHYGSASGIVLQKKGTSYTGPSHDAIRICAV
jgi:hypothetical protein